MKSVGSFEIPLKLASEVMVTLKIEVVAKG
ncbi:MAG: hypothetical protein ACREJ3_16705 [Polyangiaceae bacterium]